MLQSTIANSCYTRGFIRPKFPINNPLGGIRDLMANFNDLLKGFVGSHILTSQLANLCQANIRVTHNKDVGIMDFVNFFWKTVDPYRHMHEVAIKQNRTIFLTKNKIMTLPPFYVWYNFSVVLLVNSQNKLELNMSKVTSYKEWISNVNLEGHQDVYDLYNSVNNYESAGKFHTSKEITNAGSEYLVKAEGNQDSLFLESEEEKFSFLQHIADEYTDSGDGNVETWYKLKKELNNID